MISYKAQGPEVLYTTEPVTAVDGSDLERLKAMAADNPRRRVRLCAHPETADALHEMLIVLRRGAYFPPHMHLGKSESFHIIEGTLTVLLFDESGRVQRRIDMGDVGSGMPFFYRLNQARFHTVIPTSETVVFHETTNGPFDPATTVTAPWAPAADASLAEQQSWCAVLLGGDL